MTNRSGIGSGARLALGAVTTAGVLGGGVYLAANGIFGPSMQSAVRAVYQSLGGGDDTFAVAAPLSTDAGASLNRPLVDPTPMATTPESVEPVQGITPQSGEVAMPAPLLDLVRIDADGSGLVAGSALPGAMVSILLDGAELETLVVPPEGEFATFVTIVPSDVPQVLSLVAQYDSVQVPSEARFILAPVVAAQAPATVAAQAVDPDAADIASVAGDALSETTPAITVAENAIGEAADLLPSGDSPVPESTVSADPASTGEPSLDVAQISSNEGASQNADLQSSEFAQISDAVVTSGVTTQGIETSAFDTVSAATEEGETAQLTPAPSDVASVDPAAPTSPSGTEPATAQTGLATKESRGAETKAMTAAASNTQAIRPEADVTADAQSAPKPQAAIAVLRADKDGVSLVQPGTQVAPELLDKIVLDTISYSDAGGVQLSGRARPQALVRVYLDNAPVIDLQTQQDGRWSGHLTSVAPGIYTLRLDELDPIEGKVLSRLETPFKRETPEALQPASQDNTPGQPPLRAVRAVTVQRGDTLWAISHDRYGTGFLYVRVFEANRDAIRDPDLIYPGQIFTLPE